MVRAEIGDCQRCGLCEYRTSIVVGTGNPTARIMVIGEAPSTPDDRRGSPFLGEVGSEIDRLLREIGLTRVDVYMTHLVKCRPLAQRPPSWEEMKACRPFLQRQIEAVDPRVIIALGRQVSNQLLDNMIPLSALRGRWYDLPGREGLTRVVPAIHPAWVLRNCEDMRMIQADFKLAREAL